MINFSAITKIPKEIALTNKKGGWRAKRAGGLAPLLPSIILIFRLYAVLRVNTTKFIDLEYSVKSQIIINANYVYFNKIFKLKSLEKKHLQMRFDPSSAEQTGASFPTCYISKTKHYIWR